ncbi:MAG: sulfite exporter TauE/SafE family protein [Nitrospiraceae bacterium]
MDLTVLVLITLFAATVNGALGYGFSSLTVPVALLFYTNRILNPALVMVEVVINGYVLLINRKSVPHIWKRVLPILLGVLPGVMIGSYVLFMVQPAWLKFFTYLVLLPFILLQAAGVRKPIRAEKLVGVPFGMGIGTLYSVTTISGPPLALLFNNQGYAKQQFRAALSLIRVAESTLTAVAYYFLGLYSMDSAQLLPYIVPSVLVGIPLGTYLINRMDPEVFRRLCMSFDAVVVGFGMSRVLVELKLAPSPDAYSVLAAVVAIDAYLLYRFFQKRRSFT